MIIIGITGSIGMGKSTIANMLQRLNIPVFDSDKEVKVILEKNTAVKKRIYDLWPEVVLTYKNEEKINKKLLGEKIFNSKKNRKILEQIIHPLVQEQRNIFIKKVKKSYIIALDVPLLYETGTDKICDDIFLAYTNEKIQKKRVLARPNMNEKKLNLIKKAQWSIEKKESKRPYLITTSYGKLITFIITFVSLIIVVFRRKFLKL